MTNIQIINKYNETKSQYNETQLEMFKSVLYNGENSQTTTSLLKKTNKLQKQLEILTRQMSIIVKAGITVC